ncbi:MAG: hypothetical protein GTO45_32075 [Candidatus Aminicenantes bacterium]|nr:hypothetical protein [Candidatus Aminicenantes bacterium]NIM83387.1 hypothetical protein [Candidatus Aminicenantes bacterium]NIN22779.1 hypothetical protein [Candidatus Aminicenantes bacterium]NIN46513.1 hypothetical protein [Candidatus Aminicenantes bacterium]NIN89418.1 hypothetical protein [Candidatus Aminicenantes bacterium]
MQRQHIISLLSGRTLPGERRKLVLKLVLSALFLLLQVYLLFFKSVEVMDYSRYINEFPLPLSGENKNVSQEFRTSGPLARIDIMLANYKIKPKGGILRLSIFKGDNPLYLKNYPANTVEDNRFYSFTIHANNIPAGNYRLRLDHFPKNKNERLAAWTSKKSVYPFGSLYVNNKQEQGDLTFRVYYYSSIWKEKQRWLNQLPQLKFRPYILVFGLLLLFFMVNFLFYYFVNKLMGAIGE